MQQSVLICRSRNLAAFHSCSALDAQSSVAVAGKGDKGDRDRERNGGGFRDRLDRDREGGEEALKSSQFCFELCLFMIFCVGRVMQVGLTLQLMVISMAPRDNLR